MKRLINCFALGLIGSGLINPAAARQAEGEIAAAPVADTTAPTAQAAAEAAPLDTIPLAEPAQAEAPQPAARSASRLIEEVIVTSQKREENLQDVPISVQVFSAEALDARGVSDALNLRRSRPAWCIR